jgi:putative (di)nucleoside polyphosphate hydrolase
MTDLKQYRPNVGVVPFHPDGHVWLGRRIGAAGPHNWQFPQGGVDAGEDLESAARRELAEETGIRTAALLGRTEGWLTYDFPAGHERRKGRDWKGQRQVWFAMRVDGGEAEIDLATHGHPEFDAWRWARLDETLDLVVPFKRETYVQVIAAFAPFAGIAT